MRALLCSSVAVALICGHPSPAYATTSAQIAIAGANQTDASCPVTLRLTGFVTGPPSVPFEYWFFNTRNGSREMSGRVAALMPPTGVAQISGSITIDASTDPVTESHVQLQAATPGQPAPTLSNEAAFAIVCRPPSSAPPQRSATQSSAPNAPPGLDSLSGKMLAIVPSAPTGLTSTLDPKVCGDHAGLAGFICLATIPAGYLTLVWDWAPSAAYQDLDGYRLYRVDGGRKIVVGTQNSADVKIQAFEQPASGFAGQCFAVSAHKHGAESALSNPFCPAGGSATQTITLSPTQQRSAVITGGDTTGLSGELAPGAHSSTGSSPDALKVGYQSYTSKFALGDTFTNFAYRAGYFFDTAAVKSRPIYRASLKLHVASSLISGSRDTFWSCATAIGIAADPWWQSTGWINGEFGGVNPGRVHGPDVALDVTQIVADWASGRASNYGFVLKGESENIGAFLNDSCLSTFTNPALDIVYS